MLPNGNLFVTGFRANTNGDNDRLLVVLFDTELNVLSEKLYECIGQGTLFRSTSEVVLDSDGNAVVFTSQIVPESGGLRRFPAILYRFNEEGDTIMHRDLYDVDLEPMYYTQTFEPEQLYYDSDRREFQYVGQGLNGFVSIEYFDNDLNFISGHQILYQGADTTLMIDAIYDSDWITENGETVIFGYSANSMDKKFLVAYKIDRIGYFLYNRAICRKTDTIDYAATTKCMAGIDDSTLYCFFHETSEPWASGNLGVYRLNENFEVLGSYFHNNEKPLWAESIHPTPYGGCILVADSVRGDVSSSFHQIDTQRFYIHSAFCAVTHNGHAPW